MVRTLSALSLGSLFILLTTAAHAGPLAPSKASEIVAVNSRTPCQTSPGNCADVTPPGPLPPKRVLVVTGFGWNDVEAPPSSFVRVLLVSVPSGKLRAIGGSMADGLGQTAGTQQVSPGVVVRSGETLCVCVAHTGTPGNAEGQLHGFLARDK
jgi:hypothetical protein